MLICLRTEHGPGYSKDIRGLENMGHAQLEQNGQPIKGYIHGREDPTNMGQAQIEQCGTAHKGCYLWPRRPTKHGPGTTWNKQDGP